MKLELGSVVCKHVDEVRDGYCYFAKSWIKIKVSPPSFFYTIQVKGGKKKKQHERK